MAGERQLPSERLTGPTPHALRVCAPESRVLQRYCKRQNKTIMENES